MKTNIPDVFRTGLVGNAQADEIAAISLTFAQNLVALAQAANRRDSDLYLDALRRVIVDINEFHRVLEMIRAREQLLSGDLESH